MVDDDGVPTAVGRHGNPAGFWVRLIALLVDAVIITFASAIFSLTGVDFSFGILQIDDSAGFRFNFEVDLPASVALVVYATLFVSIWGTTPGKKVFNIYVYSRDGKTPPSFPRVLVRELSKYLSTIIIFIGFIMAAFRKDKRALHDLIGGTFPTVKR